MAEVAVHLDRVRDGRANEDFQNPVRFFERTFLTKNPLQTTDEVVRRVSGVKTETLKIKEVILRSAGA